MHLERHVTHATQRHAPVADTVGRGKIAGGSDRGRPAAADWIFRVRDTGEAAQVIKVVADSTVDAPLDSTLTLVQRARGGDRAALEQIFERYRSPLVRLALVGVSTAMISYPYTGSSRRIMNR